MCCCCCCCDDDDDDADDDDDDADDDDASPKVSPLLLDHTIFAGLQKMEGSSMTGILHSAALSTCFRHPSRLI